MDSLSQMIDIERSCRGELTGDGVSYLLKTVAFCMHASYHAFGRFTGMRSSSKGRSKKDQAEKMEKTQVYVIQVIRTVTAETTESGRVLVGADSLEQARAALMDADPAKFDDAVDWREINTVCQDLDYLVEGGEALSTNADARVFSVLDLVSA
jgi:hypothetical protein